MKRLFCIPLALICCIFLFSGCDADENEQLYSAVDQTIHDTVTSIQVGWVSGDVQFLRSEDDSIRIVQLAPNNFAKEKLLTYSVTNGLLEITDLNKTKVGFSSGTDLKIYCPKQTFEKISVQCTSGTITGDNLHSKIFDGGTTAGNIDIDGTFESIESDCSSGDTLISCQDMPKSTSLTGTVNDIVLELPENNGFTLLFDTATGDIDSDFPLQKDGENYVYKDGSNTINVDITSGQLAIYQVK